MAYPFRNLSPMFRPARIAAGAVRLYQLVLSPLMSPSCRHLPTCSDYAIEALREHGVLRGGWLAARRIARCHPFGTSGFDPVSMRGGDYRGTPADGPAVSRSGPHARGASAPAGLVAEGHPVDAGMPGPASREVGMRRVRPARGGRDGAGRGR